MFIHKITLSGEKGSIDYISLKFLYKQFGENKSLKSKWKQLKWKCTSKCYLITKEKNKKAQCRDLPMKIFLWMSEKVK